MSRGLGEEGGVKEGEDGEAGRVKDGSLGSG